MNPQKKGETYRERSKERDIRLSNMIAAKAVSDAVRTSLGPRGMDKMIQKSDGDVITTNDGATILSQMRVFHPAAKMLVELSKSQDIEAGDGTTSVCVLAGSMLKTCQDLIEKGIHPTIIAEAFKRASDKAGEILQSISVPVDLTNRSLLLDAVNTCLSSKVVFQNAEVLSPIAVDAVLSVIDPATATDVDLRNIKVVRQIGGTVDDSELVAGLVLNKGAVVTNNGPTRIENARIALIQFWLSAPKTDMENSVVVSDYAAMDRIMREERKYVATLCKKIASSGCNVLLIQKSILRDAYNDMSLHFLAKLGILAVVDVERNDVDFICKSLGCIPVAHIDGMTGDKLGHAACVENVSMSSDSSSAVVKITGISSSSHSRHSNMSRSPSSLSQSSSSSYTGTITILLRGSNKLVVDEADRSMHDALCVVRSLVKQRHMIAGGGYPEMSLCCQLSSWSASQASAIGYCVRAYAQALEIVPYTLAENAGVSPIEAICELRSRNLANEGRFGISKDGAIVDMWNERVVQPMLVSLSEIKLATECVGMILKIDDLVRPLLI